MRNLLNFILRFSTVFLFVLYAAISCVLLFGGSEFHKAVYLTSANRVCAGVNGARSDVQSYFHLREMNRDLLASNSELERRVLNMEEQIKEYQALLGDTVAPGEMPVRFNYVIASVVNNSTRHKNNYITIDRGSLDGLESGMGVVDHNGVIGIVDHVRPHTSRIISLLNSEQRFSVKLKGTDYLGSVTWKGGDPNVAYVEEVPRHAKFQTGDTVVTSGFSTTFPEGLVVGTVENQVRAKDESFFTLKIRLKPDFSNLRAVRVITDTYKPELDSLARTDTDPKKRHK